VRAQGGKHVYNSETWEKAFFERLEQRTTALDAARGCLRPRGWLYLVRNTIYLVSSSAMPSIDRVDDHLEGLRDALAQMSFTLMAVLTEVAAEHDLSLTQLRVLGILRDREPTMADLATFTGLERSTISGLIDRAAQRGLVVKTADPHDGRSVRVTLTESARGLVPAMTAAIGDRITPLTGRLSTDEQRRLTALLTKALGLANP
jgi:MarR family transcriptional regulator, lower aerobic nicotinate degradation pathway regulator